MRAREVLEDAMQATSGLFEMANLRQSQTGVPGTIYISTQQASHGPRVKYYVNRPGNSVPSFSVSIGADPQIVESSLPANVTSRVGPMVIAWVKSNHERLLDFWNNGPTWFDQEVNAFKKALVKLPRR